MRIEIVIPAYNEEKRIGKTLESYCNFFNKELKKKYQILVVINGTKDRTEEVVKRFKKKYPKIKYLNFKESGKDFAIIQGFKEAIKEKFDLIGFVDADMATSPKSFYDLIANIENYDGIIASRWRKDSVIKGKKSNLRKVYSWGFNLAIKKILSLNFSDTQCGAKLFRRQALERVINELGTTKWAFDIDLLYKMKKKGCKIKEIPTIWEDQEGSKLSLIKTPIQMFSSVVRLRLIDSHFKFIVDVYDKLPEKLKIHNW